MTKKQFHAALTSWYLSISSKITNENSSESFEDLARQYGKIITTQENLEEVSECFNWEKIQELIKKAI